MSRNSAALLLLLLALNSLVYPLTFEHRDPITGSSLQCDTCPPGTFLRARCSTERSSDCAPCPRGSFTALWNFIGKCLRCGICGRNQVVKKECSAESDCQCECRQGFFYRQESDMCVQHSECPSGHGVQSAGTPKTDTVCHICSNDTYSDISSAHAGCKQHKHCGAGQQLVLKGSTWHDSLCANCGDHKDGAEYLKEIIPTFFNHHKMNIKRLRRIVNKLPSGDGNKHGRHLELNPSELYSRISSWVSSGTATQIKMLPDILNKVGANSSGEKLQKKLSQIDTHLTESCNSGSVREVDSTL